MQILRKLFLCTCDLRFPGDLSLMNENRGCNNQNIVLVHNNSSQSYAILQRALQLKTKTGYILYDDPLVYSTPRNVCSSVPKRCIFFP